MGRRPEEKWREALFEGLIAARTGAALHQAKIQSRPPGTDLKRVYTEIGKGIFHWRQACLWPTLPEAKGAYHGPADQICIG